jgi:phosphoglycerate dehydrogenase-like enzyme
LLQLNNINIVNTKEMSKVKLGINGFGRIGRIVLESLSIEIM